MKTEQPDYEIKIGIKNGKVVKVDWEHLHNFEKVSNKDLSKVLKKYLVDAEIFVKDAKLQNI